MATLTLTRALQELKTLADRIAKAIKDLELAVVEPFDIQSNNKKDLVDKTLAQAKADFQSVEALIARRNLIQDLLLRANSTTVVKIGDKSYTIAEAIAAKKNISIEVALLAKLKQQRAAVNAKLETQTATFNTKVEAYIVLKTNGTPVKDRKPETVAELTQEFSKLNLPTVYEGVDIAGKIKFYDDYITFFLGEVDTVLSEVNATTTFEIPD
jgi:hypothetical protein